MLFGVCSLMTPERASVNAIIRTTLSATVACAAIGASAAGLSDAERSIVESVKSRNAAALQLIERTVNVNSGTMNFEGVREVGRMFRAEFDALGFSTRWVEMPP